MNWEVFFESLCIDADTDREARRIAEEELSKGNVEIERVEKL